MKKTTLILFLLLFFSGEFIFAQRPDAEAVLLKKQIRIGERAELKLAIRYHEGINKSIVIWPELVDTLTYGVDIVKTDSIKTVLASRSSVLYQQSRSIYITAFDSGMYVLPPQKFVVDNDTVQTLPLELHVVSVAVDTTKPIKDIKDIYDVPPAPPVIEPEKPLAWWAWTLIGIAVLGILALIYFLTRKKKELPSQLSSKQLLPHEKILEQLAELGKQKPWLHGELKKYHISLTEILRSWIVERYLIHAKEMTTGEIIQALHSHRADASAILQLTRVLRTADLVKFGKEIPPAEENENVLQLAINFVKATAIYPEPPTPTPPIE
jgi:hypothetical protein